VDAERLRGEGNLAYLLGRARLWGEGGWGLKKLSSITGGDRQLEPGDEDADDVRHDEHMFA
jgi:hypothetical protein